MTSDSAGFPLQSQGRGIYMTRGGLVAERPCTGLQIPLPRFDSGRGLHAGISEICLQHSMTRSILGMAVTSQRRRANTAFPRKTGWTSRRASTPFHVPLGALASSYRAFPTATIWNRWFRLRARPIPSRRIPGSSRCQERKSLFASCRD